MFKGIYNVHFAGFRCKDNIKVEQKSSTPILFNLKKANFLPCDRNRCHMAETAAPFTIARRWSRIAMKIRKKISNFAEY